MPNISLDLDQAQEWKLQRAILLYESPRHTAFATVHAVDGRRLEPGRPMSSGELRAALAAIDQTSAEVCLLPPEVLAFAPGLLAWWRPPRPATLFFAIHDKAGKIDRAHPLTALSGSRFPMPPLVWLVRDGKLRLWATPHDRRPVAGTRLHPTPFYNCYENGGICEGTMPALPRNPSPTDIPRIEKAFFQSNFTHGGIGVRKHPAIRSHADLWKLARRKRAFPVRLLHRSTTTLAKVLQS